MVRFGCDDGRYGCLCTFPYNYSAKKFGIPTVESMALIGAALVMSVNGGLQETESAYDDEYIIPDCLPLWVRQEIRRNIGDYPEEFDIPIDDGIEITEEGQKKMLLKRFQEIKDWAEVAIKEINNGTYFD